MKYALISDIHGNIFAIQAVINDAKNNDVNQFVFLGDYCTGLAYPNEVLDCIRVLENRYVVSGNEDDALVHWKNTHKCHWPDGQFEAQPWSYKNLTDVNKNFVCALPHEIIIKTDNQSPIYLFYKPERYFSESSPSKINPQYYAKNIDDKLFTVQSFDIHCDNVINNDLLLSEQLSKLDDGVFVFGHKHIQWCKEKNGKLLINPGSCGVPLDFQTTAAYAILQHNELTWKCDLRRVEYDVSKAIEDMDNSKCAKELPVWYGIISSEMKTAREQAIPFLNFTEQYANSMGDTIRPFNRETWYESYEAWVGSKNQKYNMI